MAGGAGLRLSRVNRSGIYQHDGDVILNGVNTATHAAFQALSIRIERHGFLANRANQHIQQILGNHDSVIVTRIKPLDLSVIAHAACV